MTNFQTKFSVGRVDRTNGVIYGVSLITCGHVIGHGLEADQTTLQTVLEACRKVGNLKCKVNHTTDVQSICGTFSNYRIDGEKLLADLTLLKSSPSYEWALDIAERLPSQTGLSIAFSPETVNRDGKKYVRCLEIYSADWVDAPASNPSGLFDASPTLTNASTSIPTGVKPKTRTVSVVCPNCEAYMETFSKLATLHSSAADRLESLCSVLEPKDNISSVPTDQQFQARLNEQRLELEANLDKRASVMASRMLASTGIKLSKIPDADTCLNTSDTILARLESISDPTEKGRFFQANKAAIRTAYQRQASKNIDLENRVKATEVQPPCQLY
jgi:hypothetical protein